MVLNCLSKHFVSIFLLTTGIRFRDQLLFATAPEIQQWDCVEKSEEEIYLVKKIIAYNLHFA